MFTVSRVCVCVGRVLPVTHRGSLTLRNVAAKSGKTWGGAGTSGAAWDKAGQDGTWEGRTVVCEATGNSTASSRNSALPLDDTD